MEGNPGVLTPPSFSPWEKREGAIARVSHQTSPQGASTGECNGAPFVDRVLIGHNDLGAEARIRIVSGPIAGAEVQLIAGKNGVEASVLTAPENSRRNVDYAMEEMAYRLRRRGYSVQVTDPSLARRKKTEQESNESDER